MWRDYVKSYRQNNRAASISIIAAVLVAALFLSMMCTLLYNFWVYDTETIILEEGDWQGRITAPLTEAQRQMIQAYGNVESMRIREDLSDDVNSVVDIYFYHPSTCYFDMQQLTESLGIDREAAVCHDTLLSRYLINNPEDSSPPMLLPFYIGLLCITALALILIIHNAFAAVMQAQVHQLGILTSIGASPKQIFCCMLQEAAAMCALPAVGGIGIGVLMSVGICCAIEMLASEIAGRHTLVFQYHPAILVSTLLVVGITVLLSALFPAVKVSKITPMEAIRYQEKLQVKVKKRPPLLGRIFGIEGELAGNALRAQKKTLRTATLSLILAFLAFMLLLSFFTLSDISTRHTYFERYQNAWDVMATLKNRDIRQLDTTFIQQLPNAADTVIYQKAEATALLGDETLSDALRAAGGLSALDTSIGQRSDGKWEVAADLVVVDDAAFLKYCETIGCQPRLDAVIIYNQIWNSTTSNFRYPEYIPYVKALEEVTLADNAGNTMTVPVAACTDTVLPLREEYADYHLVQFVPLSLWQHVSQVVGQAEETVYIRILAEEKTASALNELQQSLALQLGLNVSDEIENRIQEQRSNDRMILGYKIVIGGGCLLLAGVGVAGIFSNTLSFLRQRRREFARYLSIGMTPAQMKRMFLIEALVVAGKPAAITLPMTALIVGWMIRMSYLNPMEFLQEAPIIPTLVFFIAVFICVGIAYYLGGRAVLKNDLAALLRDDTMM